ncbi:MAG: hypothetical protein LBR72_05055, partial [Oscillospiraceae bacterium]|nr:hypothetical protein [Oscillospiraceae bacterium]
LIEHSFLLPKAAVTDAELTVHIRPALREAESHRPAMGASAMKYNGASLYTRKAPHMYGWDIMPRILSGGLWRPARIEFRPETRIEETYLVTSELNPNAGSAAVMLCYAVRRGGEKDLSIRCEGVCGESRFLAEEPLWFHSGRLYAHIPDARLWWPRGRGEQNLYTVTVTLLQNGEAIDRKVFRAGLRTDALDHAPVGPDAPEGNFQIKVNGEPVFILGANWVPADAFHSRDNARIPAMLELLSDIGCNAVRCWGGNVYEDDTFFDICDEKGILVWQDFAMACALYPQDGVMRRALRAEAVSVTRKLRQHPSLCLWAGDNECDQSYVFQRPARDPNHNVLTRRVLPEVLREHDGFRPYLPSSPYYDEASVRNKTGIPEDHLWGARQYFKDGYYARSKARFVSEIGYHGCPSPGSVARFISPENLWPRRNREWILHSTSPEPVAESPYGYRNELMSQQIRHLFDADPDSLERFALASQLTQAEAMKYFIELFRSQKGLRTGIIWWNLIDGWPQFSDAVADYYFKRKQAYAVIRRSQTPVCIMASDQGNEDVALYAANDTKGKVSVAYKVYDAWDHRRELLSGALELKPDSVLRLTALAPKGEQTMLIIEYTADGESFKNYYLYGRPTFDFDAVLDTLRAEGLFEAEGFREEAEGLSRR